MNKLIASILLAPSLLFAQGIQVAVDIPLPTISFEVAPPVVVVQPGVQVVENYDQEVYFVDNFYWVRRDGRWFRTHDHRGKWVVVEERVVPTTIVRLPPGKYKHWKAKQKEVVVVPAAHHDSGHGKDKGGHGGKQKGKGKK